MDQTSYSSNSKSSSNMSSSTTTTTTCDINLCQLPDLVLDTILDHLPYSELKNLLSVCHKLNTFSLAALRRKRVIRISTNTGKKWGPCELFEFDLDHKSFDLICESPNIFASPLLNEIKYHGMFDKLFHHCPFVKQLELSISHPALMQYVTKLLEHWRQTLTHLTIVGDIRNIESLLVDCIKQIPNLKYLSIPFEHQQILRAVQPQQESKLEHINFVLSNNDTPQMVQQLASTIKHIRSYGIWYMTEMYNRDNYRKIRENIVNFVQQQKQDSGAKLTRLNAHFSRVFTTETVLSHCDSLTYLWLNFPIHGQRAFPLNALLCIISDNLKQLRDLRIHYHYYLAKRHVQYERSIEPATLCHRLPSVRTLELICPLPPSMFAPLRSLFSFDCSISNWYFKHYFCGIQDFTLLRSLLCKPEQQCVHNCAKLYQVMDDECRFGQRQIVKYSNVDDINGYVARKRLSPYSMRYPLRVTIAPDGTVQHGEVVNFDHYNNRFHDFLANTIDDGDGDD